MKKTIFLVMDMMNDLVAADGAHASTYAAQVSARGLLHRVRSAIAGARAASVMIGYVRVGFSPDYREAPESSPLFSGVRKYGVFKLGDRGTEIHPSIAPQERDFDIVKHRVSPFYATSLEVILRAHKIDRIVMCGVSTNGVVHSGAREAHDRDYDVVILEDCCAGMTPEEHVNAIACLDRYAAIVSSDAFDWRS